MRIWVSTMFILISLKTEIARSVNGPKLQGVPCRRCNGKAVPRAANFGDLITADQKGPKRQLRISKQSSICSRGAGSSYSMDPGVSVQDQKFTRNPEERASSWSRGETKSNLNNSLEFGKACEDLSWNHCTHVYTTPIGD